MTSVEALARLGQSVWLDTLDRASTRSGVLTARIAEGIGGVVATPSDITNALVASDDDHDDLAELVAAPDQDAAAIYEFIVVQDVREAADALRPTYEATKGRDGFVSLQVAPSLARDAEGTIEQARRLWASVDRPNIMINVPGTPEALRAIEELLSLGLNVNVSLIFSRGAYHSIADAFVAGAERWVADGGAPGQLASVASFYADRINEEVDARLTVLAERITDPARRSELSALRGQATVAMAKLAYEIYRRMVGGTRFAALAKLGVRPQRLLWAGTAATSVDALLGPDTVRAVGPDTLASWTGHGTAAATLEAGRERARQVLEDLEGFGISMGDVTDHLLERSVEQLEDEMDDLLSTIASRQRTHRGSRLNRLSSQLDARLTAAVEQAGTRWDAAGNTQRLWARDASLWTDGDEGQWLGWLDVVDRQRKRVAYFAGLRSAFAARAWTDIVLLGMGGSSLGAEMLAQVFGSTEEVPRFSLVDSTDPTQVKAIPTRVDLERTLFIVASKSGTTLESRALLAHFEALMERRVGERAATHFMAITDPGTPLEAHARARGFWAVQHGVEEIGGRYSVFSSFGMVPATALGLPALALLEEAALMVGACGNDKAPENPGVALGLILATAAQSGHNKLTLVTTPAIAPFGTWLEHLLAESTGKHGQAIIPHEREPLLEPHGYGRDRLFVYLRLHSTPHLDQDRAVEALADAGHAVVRLDLDDTVALAQEMFRWQFATAVACALLGVNPFDQPDVAASQEETRAMLKAFTRARALPSQSPLWSGEGVSLFATPNNAAALRASLDGPPQLADWLYAHFVRLRRDDFVGLLCYLPMTSAHERALHEIRSVILEATGAATCVSFGPRLLHSTGQLYKGGPNRGLLIQLSCADEEDLPVPGQRATFGVLKAAQARGDAAVLATRGRRLLRIHLRHGTAVGLRTLLDATATALARLRETEELD